MAAPPRKVLIVDDEPRIVEVVSGYLVRAGFEPVEDLVAHALGDEPRDGSVEIGVTDTGIGIGLSIAKAIVDAHGGTISTVSQPGKGSDFRITLPRGPAA